MGKPLPHLQRGQIGQLFQISNAIRCLPIVPLAKLLQLSDLPDGLEGLIPSGRSREGQLREIRTSPQMRQARAGEIRAIARGMKQRQPPQFPERRENVESPRRSGARHPIGWPPGSSSPDSKAR